MRTRRLLGASMATLLAVGVSGAAAPSATAGDNDNRDWLDKRVVQTPGTPDGAVHVLSGRSTWSMVARELGAGTDTWRLRESTSGNLGYTSPASVPSQVQSFRSDINRQGRTWVAYLADGALRAAFHTRTQATMIPAATPLAPEVAGAGAPRVTVGDWPEDPNEIGSTPLVIEYGGTWHETSPTAAVFTATPEPAFLPDAYTLDYDADGRLLAFWQDAAGDLMAARRGPNPTDAFSAPQKVAAGEKAVRLVETAQGGRLVTQSTDGSINLYAYTSDAATFSFTQRRVLAGAATDAPAPQVIVDALGTLTIGWRETGVTGGGLVLWQEDRPESTFLERGNLVPGTRDGEARVVTSPRGSLTVALRRDDENAIVRVKHLPAGKAKWTNGKRLISPKPLSHSAPWAIGSAQQNQDLRVAVNDQVGVYGFLFDAPPAYTKVTKPVRTRQADRTYRVGWNTSWSFADDWQVRQRLDKSRGYGPWKGVSVPEGAQSKVVTRGRGKTWCYQSRALLDGSYVTTWSKQRCVTVRG